MVQNESEQLGLKLQSAGDVVLADASGTAGGSRDMHKRQSRSPLPKHRRKCSEEVPARDLVLEGVAKGAPRNRGEVDVSCRKRSHMSESAHVMIIRNLHTCFSKVYADISSKLATAKNSRKSLETIMELEIKQECAKEDMQKAIEKCRQRECSSYKNYECPVYRNLLVAGVGAKEAIADLHSRVESGLHNLSQSSERNHKFRQHEEHRLQQEESRACDPLEWVDLRREYVIEDDVEPELEWSSSEAWLKRNMARSNDEHNVEKKDWDTKAERAREERGWFDNNTGRYHKFQPGSKVTEKVKEQHRRSHQGRK